MIVNDVHEGTELTHNIKIYDPGKSGSLTYTDIDDRIISADYTDLGNDMSISADYTDVGNDLDIYYFGDEDITLELNL